MSYQIVKPILLAVVLTFMVGSYFTSETFRRGASTWGMRLDSKRYAYPVCNQRPQVQQDQCTDAARAVLVASLLECSSQMQDHHLCQLSQQRDGNAESCRLQYESISTCLENRYLPRLRQRGFSAEEIARLGLTKDNVSNPKGDIKDKGSGEGGKEPGRTDQKALSEGSATVGRGDSNAPIVDVVERPGGGENAGAVEADTNNPSVEIEVRKQHEGEGDV